MSARLNGRYGWRRPAHQTDCASVAHALAMRPKLGHFSGLSVACLLRQGPGQVAVAVTNK
jgi:hypothetical protein